MYDKWLDEKIPDDYYLQCQWYLMITGWELWYIVCLIGNRQAVVYEIQPDEDVFKYMLDEAKYFWENNVLKNQAPAPTGDDADEVAIKRLYPEEKYKYLEEPDKIERAQTILDFYDENNYVKRMIEKIDNTHKQSIKMIMGDNEILDLPNRLITFRTQERKGYTVTAQKFRALNIGRVRKEKKNAKKE
jgi:predicted phage-related endonuclease